MLTEHTENTIVSQDFPNYLSKATAKKKTKKSKNNQ